MNQRENVWFGWGMERNRSIDCVRLCVHWRNGCIVLGRLISFWVGVVCWLFCLYCLSVARKAENTGSRPSGLLLICLVGCWLYYHGRSLTYLLFACLYGIRLKSREGKVCTCGKEDSDGGNASRHGYVSRGWEESMWPDKAGSKQGSEWMKPYMVLCCGRRNINWTINEWLWNTKCDVLCAF